MKKLEEDNYSYNFDGDGSEGFDEHFDDFEEVSGSGVISRKYSLASMGLCNVEKAGHAFYVTNAPTGAAEELSEGMGIDSAILVNFGNWDPSRLQHQIDVVSQHGTKPCRVIFRNLGKATEGHCVHLENILNRKEGYPVTSVFFVKEDGQEPPMNINQKVLLNCRELDAVTLLDSIAYGWGGTEKIDVPMKHPSASSSGYVDLDNMKTRF